MPIHTYTNWNVRPSDAEEQIEPFRKYFFICEGANTETFYFRKLIDLRKTLNIHPLIDIRLMEKTEEHSNLSYPKQLLEFAETLKDDESLDFDKEHDKIVATVDFGKNTTYTTYNNIADYLEVVNVHTEEGKLDDYIIRVKAGKHSFKYSNG